MNPKFPHLPVLGIDISKLTIDVCLRCADGCAYSAQFANLRPGFERLQHWLAAHQVDKTLCGMEATGPYPMALLWHLHTQGHVVCLLNAHRVKEYISSQGRRPQTDRSDARLIAGYLSSAERLIPWQPPTQALCDLQALVRRRQDLMDALQAERNRLAAQPSPIIKASIRRQVAQLKAEVASMNQALETHVLEHLELQKSVRLLRSIDGIGFKVACTILAEVPAISAFGRARDVAAFAGLIPCFKKSGSSVRRYGRISREGSALLRKMLYMAALQAVKRPTNAFHKAYQGFVQRGKAKMCAIVAIMHKLIRVAFGVLKHQTPFAQNLARLRT
jgi:transposase